jgi:hypothetical protein
VPSRGQEITTHDPVFADAHVATRTANRRNRVQTFRPVVAGSTLSPEVGVDVIVGWPNVPGALIRKV